MEAAGDRSAIVSASLPRLVQCSGQGFNQLHLPPLCTPLGLTPELPARLIPSISRKHACTPYVHAFLHTFPRILLWPSLPVSALLRFLLPSLTPVSQSLTPLTPPTCSIATQTWHSDTMFSSCLSQSTQLRVFDPCADFQWGSTARPVHLWKTSVLKPERV